MDAFRPLYGKLTTSTVGIVALCAEMSQDRLALQGRGLTAHHTIRDFFSRLVTENHTNVPK
jgi:hypothetical protein